MPDIKTQVELQTYNTFNVAARAAQFLALDSVAAIQQFLPIIQKEKNRIVLGGGSNLLLLEDFDGLVLYPQLFGIEDLATDKTDASRTIVRVGASENWHQWVLTSNKKGWYGLENLALIPGTVGAAPVQNIGAYGVEVQEFITQVEYLDLETGQLSWRSKKNCQFAYRDSFFKQAIQGRYLITQVEFALLNSPQLRLEYRPLNELVSSKPAAIDVINRVCEVRLEKLPDPNKLPNAGSFFKNPTIDSLHFERLCSEYPQIVGFKTEQGIKLAAGWLIDNAGLKGKRVGDVGVHQHQALVLVNYNKGSGSDIWQLALSIQKLVFEKYAVLLEPEVRRISASGFIEEEF